MPKIPFYLTVLVASSLLSYPLIAQNAFPASGNTGIGTTTPQTELHVHYIPSMMPVGMPVPIGGETNIRLTNSGSGTSSTDGLDISLKNNHAKVTNFENGYVQLNTNNGKFTLLQNGFSGINTIEPKSAFQINNSFTLHQGSSGTAMIGRNVSHNSWPEKRIADGTASGIYFTHHGHIEFFLADDGGQNTDIAWNRILKLEHNTNGGTIGINTWDPDDNYKLDVAGAARFCKIDVERVFWCDFVFSEDYKLMPLNELEQYLKENKHLPDVPSEEEVEVNGIDVAKMEATLLQKVEELTLYVIDINKQIQQLKEENEILKRKLIE